MEQTTEKLQAVASSPETSLQPAASPVACPNCGATPASAPPQPATLAVAAPSYVYAVGRIWPRFPRVSVEKEFAQAMARIDTKGLTDRQALHAVLSKPENRYLVRQMCWTMSIEGLDTYILSPRDPADFGLLVESLRAEPTPLDVDVVIGVKIGIAPASMCNGLTVPIVLFDQLYSFDREALLKSLPRADKTSAKEFARAASELFDRIIQIADNAGATDETRALNYLALRYPAIYERAAEAFEHDASLSGVDVKHSPLSGVRNVLDVIFSYTNRNTDVVEKAFVRVDVTDEFPFLVTKLSPYFDH